jgi:hypothetical protein
MSLSEAGWEGLAAQGALYQFDCWGRCFELEPLALVGREHVDGVRRDVSASLERAVR